MVSAEIRSINSTSEARRPQAFYSQEKIIAPTVVPYPIDHQNFEHGGFEKFIALDDDPATTKCDILPLAATGRNILAVNPKHVLIWKGRNKQVVVHQIDRIGQVKRLNELAIDWEGPGGFLQAVDVINEPENAQLIHIGPLNTDKDDEMVIRFLAGVDNFINIPVGSPDDLRFTHWHAGYDTETTTLSVFSGDTGAHMTANLTRQEENLHVPFYLKYLDYLRNNGCISRGFMADAVRLTLPEIMHKYKSENNFPLESPEQLAKNLATLTKIELTPEQIKILANLNAIPSDYRNSVYLDGIVPSEPGGKDMEIQFVHPYDLWGVGRLGQVLKFTGDTEKLDMLNAFDSNRRAAETPEELEWNKTIAAEKQRLELEMIESLRRETPDGESEELKRLKQKEAQVELLRESREKLLKMGLKPIY